MAASIWINSYSDVQRTTANVHYSASGYSLPGGSTGDWSGSEPSSGTTWTQSRSVSETRDLSYSWNFGEYDSSGTHTFSNLTSGAQQTISGTVTVSYQYRSGSQIRSCSREWVIVPDEKGEPSSASHWGPWSGWSTDNPSYGNWQTIELDRDSDSITVYTRPAEFTWTYSNLVANQTIQVGGLSARDWNRLATAAAQKDNWVAQSRVANYSTSISGGDLITEGRYNQMAEWCGASNRVTADVTVIRANLFTALSDAVNRSY